LVKKYLEPSEKARLMSQRSERSAAPGNHHRPTNSPEEAEFEINLKRLTFGIVVVHAKRNRIEYYRPIFPALVDAIEHVRAGEVVHVYAPPVQNPE